MTYFEFISVAMSMIFALAVADVLRASIPAVRKPARYWPHLAFLIATLLNIVYIWMALWRVRYISWTGLEFLYALVNPALLTILARLLTTRNPEKVVSFRDHFMSTKKAYFGVLAVFCVNGFFFAWIVGVLPWGSFAQAQAGSIVGLGIATLGFRLQSDRALGILGIATLLLLVALIGVAPVNLMES